MIELLKKYNKIESKLSKKTFDKNMSKKYVGSLIALIFVLYTNFPELVLKNSMLLFSFNLALFFLIKNKEKITLISYFEMFSLSLFVSFLLSILINHFIISPALILNPFVINLTLIFVFLTCFVFLTYVNNKNINEDTLLSKSEYTELSKRGCVIKEEILANVKNIEDADYLLAISNKNKLEYSSRLLQTELDKLIKKSKFATIEDYRIEQINKARNKTLLENI